MIYSNRQLFSTLKRSEMVGHVFTRVSFLVSDKMKKKENMFETPISGFCRIISDERWQNRCLRKHLRRAR